MPAVCLCVCVCVCGGGGGREERETEREGKRERERFGDGVDRGVVLSCLRYDHAYRRCALLPLVPSDGVVGIGEAEKPARASTKTAVPALVSGRENEERGAGFAWRASR